MHAGGEIWGFRDSGLALGGCMAGGSECRPRLWGMKEERSKQVPVAALVLLGMAMPTCCAADGIILDDGRILQWLLRRH